MPPKSERLQAKIETLSYSDRQRLIRRVGQQSDWFLPRMVAAEPVIRETYIPVLSSLSLLQQGELARAEQAHLRQIVAIQSDALSAILDRVDGTDKLWEVVNEEAGAELAQWQELKRSGAQKPSEWRLAMTDAAKLEDLGKLAE